MYSFKAFLLLSVFGLAQLAAAHPGQNAGGAKPPCSIITGGDGTNSANNCSVSWSDPSLLPRERFCDRNIMGYGQISIVIC
ncbi:hypothetical protein PspLS_12106 [Pyricularia sp. CBS 133598]|nr:hypothetical protein PspLS_12106 [Pyricularia sp. CBS 133598]